MDGVGIGAAFASLPILEGEEEAEGVDEEEGTMAVGFALLSEASRKREKGGRLPEGVAHKSHWHTALMRQQKQLAQAKRKRDEEEAAHAALASNWNAQHGLRRGEIVYHESMGNQPRTWQPRGVLQQAWQQIGKRGHQARGAQGAGETRRPLDCLALVAAAAIRTSQSRFQTWLEDMRPEQPLHIEHHYDPTKLMFSFGRSTAKVQTQARPLDQ